MLNLVCSQRYAAAAAAQSLQSCLALCDPMNRNPPGPSVHGTLPAKTLEGVAMPSSRLKVCRYAYGEMYSLKYIQEKLRDKV